MANRQSGVDVVSNEGRLGGMARCRTRGGVEEVEGAMGGVEGAGGEGGHEEAHVKSCIFVHTLPPILGLYDTAERVACITGG